MELLSRLKEEGAFWSYKSESVNIDSVTDNQLVALTMRHLDIPDINKLFRLYSVKYIKKIWAEELVLEGDFLYGLNRFFAWFYFDAKNPDRYLKTLETRHLNSLFGS